MTIFAVALVSLLGMQQAGPPPLPQPDLRLAAERRAIVAELDLSLARIFVAARSMRDGELLFRYVELRGANRAEFLSLLDRDSTYYDTPGVIGCIGDSYRVLALWPDHQAEAWFAPTCQRIMPAPGSAVSFDAALSPEGANALRRVLARAVGIRARRAG